MSMHALELTFPLEYQEDLWRHKPAHFISHFAGHEGPGSLHSYLKNKGWISGLSSGPQSLGRGFAVFKVTAHLTEDGFQNYREVLLYITKYLSLLRSSTFDAFHQKELVDLATIRFRFQEKRRPDDYATRIAEHMARPYPKELLLSASQLVWEWDQSTGDEKIREYLDSFRLQNGRAVLMAKKEDLERLDPNSAWESEPVYGTEYRVERLDEAFIKKASDFLPFIELIQANRLELVE